MENSTREQASDQHSFDLATYDAPWIPSSEAPWIPSSEDLRWDAIMRDLCLASEQMNGLVHKPQPRYGWRG